ncbi:MAG: TolC family protein [Deltaproteobacteria bacterium]|nr:TolC family protein [Deltaproteobacteria bacterium]
MGCKRGGWSLFLIFLIMVLCGPSALSEEKTLTLTLEESIALALQQSVLIHSAQEDIKASESGRKGALTEFLPTLNTKYYYTRLNDTPSTTIPGVGSFQMGTKDNYTWEVELTQPIFAGGKIYSNYQINSLGVGVSKMKESRSVENVVELVKTYYFNILKSERILDVAKQSVEQLKAHRDTAKSFYDVGLIPKNDLLYSEVELANGRQNLLRAENGVQLAKAQFNTVLRRSVSDPIEVRDILDYSPYDLTFDECLKTAFKNRSEITEYELVVQQAQKAVNLAGSDYYPSVNLVGNYSKYGDEPDVSGSKYSDQEDWRVMAILNWNFWEWGRTRHAVDATKSKVRQAEDALLDLEDRISLDVMSSYLNLREAEKRIFVAQTAIEQAEENFRINEERYKEQVATSTDVIDAQTLLTKTKSDYYSALSDYKVAVGKLERSMGVGYVLPKDSKNGK